MRQGRQAATAPAVTRVSRAVPKTRLERLRVARRARQLRMTALGGSLALMIGGSAGVVAVVGGSFAPKPDTVSAGEVRGRAVTQSAPTTSLAPALRPRAPQRLDATVRAATDVPASPPAVPLPGVTVHEAPGACLALDGTLADSGTLLNTTLEVQSVSLSVRWLGVDGAMLDESVGRYDLAPGDSTLWWVEGTKVDGFNGGHCAVSVTR